MRAAAEQDLRPDSCTVLVNFPRPSLCGDAVEYSAYGVAGDARPCLCVVAANDRPRSRRQKKMAGRCFQERHARPPEFEGESAAQLAGVTPGGDGRSVGLGSGALGAALC